MSGDAFKLETVPELQEPLFIAGFDGWGNTLEVATETIAYLVRRLGGEPIGHISPDAFYRYDESRPNVLIENGVLEDIALPGGTLYAARMESGEHDLVFLSADEPSLAWGAFVDGLFSSLERLGVQTVITIGSMYDSILPTERVISGITSSEELMVVLNDLNVFPVSYSGPGAIHSVIHTRAMEMGIASISLWCHCPYYLQGSPHYGLMEHLCGVLSTIGKFDLDTGDLHEGWQRLNDQIQELVENSPEIQNMIDDIRKAKVKGSFANMRAGGKDNDKVIDIQPFLDPK